MKKTPAVKLFWGCFQALGPARGKYLLGLLLSG